MEDSFFIDFNFFSFNVLMLLFGGHFGIFDFIFWKFNVSFFVYNLLLLLSPSMSLFLSFFKSPDWSLFVPLCNPNFCDFFLFKLLKLFKLFILLLLFKRENLLSETSYSFKLLFILGKTNSFFFIKERLFFFFGKFVFTFNCCILILFMLFPLYSFSLS